MLSSYQVEGPDGDMNDALTPKEVAKIIQIVVSLNDTTQIPKIRVKSIKQIS